MTFRRAVYDVVRRIPRGEVATYGQVAMLVGRARAARAVGGAMRACPDDVPWHRVVNAQGGISRRRRDSSMLTQRIRLEQEGVPLRRGKVWLARFQWEPDIRTGRLRREPKRRMVVSRTVVHGVRSSRERGGDGGGRNGPAHR